MMFNDNDFNIPPAAPLRFLAVRDGIAVLYEHPAGLAEAVASLLRELGHRVVWYPTEQLPPVAATAARPTKAERKAARRLAVV